MRLRRYNSPLHTLFQHHTRTIDIDPLLLVTTSTAQMRISRRASRKNRRNRRERGGGRGWGEVESFWSLARRADRVVGFAESFVARDRRNSIVRAGVEMEQTTTGLNFYRTDPAVDRSREVGNESGKDPFWITRRPRRG